MILVALFVCLFDINPLLGALIQLLLFYKHKNKLFLALYSFASFLDYFKINILVLILVVVIQIIHQRPPAVRLAQLHWVEQLVDEIKLIEFDLQQLVDLTAEAGLDTFPTR